MGGADLACLKVKPSSVIQGFDRELTDTSKRSQSDLRRYVIPRALAPMQCYNVAYTTKKSPQTFKGAKFKSRKQY